MNTKMSKLALAIGALVMAGGAMAQSSTATDAGTANAIVIAPITIKKNLSLEFGNIVAADGDVTVAAASGERTNTVTALSPGATQQGLIRAATFDVGGQGAYTYAITLPANDIVTLISGALTPIKVKDFTVAGTGVDSSSKTGVLAAGVATLNVGATLAMVAAQAPGAYTGTYSVTVAYN